MEKGYWVEVERVKADAAPIDNITKFAWEEDDIETVREWVDYTPDELHALDRAEVAAALEETREEIIDILADAIEAGLLGAVTGDKKEMLRRRKELRRVLKSLQ